jgi:hypothetical protein
MRDQLLLFQHELEKGFVGVYVRILDTLVEPAVRSGHKSQETAHFGSFINAMSSSSTSSTFLTSIPHSRMTFRYLPASSILCFQGCKKPGMQAPPGRRLVPARGGGTPAESEPGLLAALDGFAREDPSRSCNQF